MKNGMDLQELFDIGVCGVIKQGQASFNGNTCKYRLYMNADCPIKCVLGYLIDDDDYRREFDVFNDVITIIKKTITNDENLWYALVDLQSCHDGPAQNDNFMEEFYKEVLCYANRHDLYTDKVNEAYAEYIASL